MRILIFGDSITEGYFDLERGGWVNRLKIDFWRQSKGIEVANLGVSGDEITDIIKRFDIEVKSFTEKYNDKLKIVFAIGINDSVTNLEQTNEAYSIDEFRENLEKLYLLAKNYTHDICFLGLTKVDEKLLSPFPGSSTGKCYKNKRIKDFDKIIQNMSKKNNIKYLNLFDVLNNEDLSDGLHPNPDGHQKIYIKVKEFLNI